MRILVIGGTQFVGRAFVDEAARRGHELTLFHRGSTEPDGLPAVEHVHGDRNGDLGLLKRSTWDAALDTNAYFPRAVRELASVLVDSVERFTLVSTISVYPLDSPPGITETSPLRAPLNDGTEVVDGETYGPLKVACEAEARSAFGERCLVIRPGYIIGPNDPTDRFTSYVRRAAAGGEMLAPGPPEAPVQLIDTRDLAAFMVDRIEANDTGTYGVAGPAAPLTMREVLETASSVGRGGTTLTWVSPEFLNQQLGNERWSLIPMWHPEFPGMSGFDASKARAAGLQFQPLAETISDILEWDRDRGSPPLKAGLSIDRERKLLEALTARG